MIKRIRAAFSAIALILVGVTPAYSASLQHKIPAINFPHPLPLDLKLWGDDQLLCLYSEEVGLGRAADGRVHARLIGDVHNDHATWKERPFSGSQIHFCFIGESRTEIAIGIPAIIGEKSSAKRLIGIDLGVSMLCTDFGGEAWFSITGEKIYQRGHWVVIVCNGGDVRRRNNSGICDFEADTQERSPRSNVSRHRIFRDACLTDFDPRPLLAQEGLGGHINLILADSAGLDRNSQGKDRNNNGQSVEDSGAHILGVPLRKIAYLSAMTVSAYVLMVFSGLWITFAVSVPKHTRFGWKVFDIFGVERFAVWVRIAVALSFFALSGTLIFCVVHLALSQ